MPLAGNQEPRTIFVVWVSWILRILKLNSLKWVSVCHKHNSCKILGREACLGSNPPHPSQNIYFFLVSNKQELIVDCLENTGMYNKEKKSILNCTAQKNSPRTSVFSLLALSPSTSFTLYRMFCNLLFIFKNYIMTHFHVIKYFKETVWWQHYGFCRVNVNLYWSEFMLFSIFHCNK